MSVYFLSDDPVFPDPETSEPVGLLALGGDLSVKRLVAAYSMGIFPWYTEDTPILWWSPDPRPIIEPRELHIPKSLRRVLNKERFSVTVDHDFAGVIRSCASVPREGADGTWLVPEMVSAYEELHRAGFAHSVEVWAEGELVGGIYGVSLGRAFFGESMFHTVTNASKVGFVHLVRLLGTKGYSFMDCQQQSANLQRYGVREIPRREFLYRLQEAVRSGVPHWDSPEESRLDTVA
ncbi:MAG: leucyl/phenylalanyl-tRNA--protein transferase [Desulfovibrionales bacterium]